MEKEMLNKILDEHKEWLETCGKKGKKANLSGANLCYANLSEAEKDGYPAFDLNKHDFESNGLSELSKSGQYFYEVIGNIHDNKLETFERR